MNTAVYRLHVSWREVEKGLRYWSIMNTIYDLHLSYFVLLCLTCCHNVISVVLEMLLAQRHAQSAIFYLFPQLLVTLRNQINKPVSVKLMLHAYWLVRER